MRSHSLLFTAMILICSATMLPAGTIRVPGDQPTIQAGIDAAAPGDTVLVADGTYTGEGNRDIDFLGKAIVVMSENGYENCIIDCEGMWQDPHRGFYFHSGESSSSLLKGFTVRNGVASYDYPEDAGGAVYCIDSSPVIEGNLLANNYADGYGGAIACVSSSAHVIGNRVIDNTSTFGGGIYCSGSSPVIEDNIITGNAGANGLYTDGAGGGILCEDGYRIVISGNLISGNYAWYYEIYWDTPIGGVGAWASESIEISYNVIEGNWCRGHSGGVYCEAPDVTMIGNTIIGNTSEANWWLIDPGLGGGIDCRNSALTLIGNTIANNVSEGAEEEYGPAPGRGGGIFCVNSTFEMTGNTITGNVAQNALWVAGLGGGFQGEAVSGTMTNNIFWNDVADSGREISLAVNSVVNVDYTDVGGGRPSVRLEPGSIILPGPGIIVSDPLFADPGTGDYNLSPESPCIDAGDPGMPCVPWGGRRLDMGAHEFDQGFYWDGRNLILKPIPIHVSLKR